MADARTDLLGSEAPHAPLLDLILVKRAGMEAEDKPWRFAGVASDETTDTEGDEILKKHLDLSYAQQRGYVNWDHSRAPADQLGFLTKATLIEGDERKKLEDELEVPVSPTASVFVEGELYKHVDRSKDVRNILLSVPKGTPGLGLSLDGTMAKNLETLRVVRAVVRGVAFTPVPAHIRTASALMKSIQEEERDLLERAGELPDAVAQRVVEALRVELLKKSLPGLTHDEAVLWVLRKKPHWTYAVASMLVKYTMERSERR